MLHVRSPRDIAPPPCRPPHSMCDYPEPTEDRLIRTARAPATAQRHSPRSSSPEHCPPRGIQPTLDRPRYRSAGRSRRLGPSATPPHSPWPLPPTAPRRDILRRYAPRLPASTAPLATVLQCTLRARRDRPAVQASYRCGSRIPSGVAPASLRPPEPPRSSRDGSAALPRTPNRRPVSAQRTRTWARRQSRLPSLRSVAGRRPCNMVLVGPLLSH